MRAWFKCLEINKPNRDFKEFLDGLRRAIPKDEVGIDIKVPEEVCKKYACFKQTLMQTLNAELGNDLNEALQEYCQIYGIDKTEYAIEDPAAFKHIFEECKKKSKSSLTLEKVIKEIMSNVP
jgi:hypothetical protein